MQAAQKFPGHRRFLTTEQESGFADAEARSSKNQTGCRHDIAQSCNGRTFTRRKGEETSPEFVHTISDAVAPHPQTVRGMWAESSWDVQSVRIFMETFVEFVPDRSRMRGGGF